MVFLCHDINDIFLEGAKMARYTEHRRVLAVSSACACGGAGGARRADERSG